MYTILRLLLIIHTRRYNLARKALILSMIQRTRVPTITKADTLTRGLKARGFHVGSPEYRLTWSHKEVGEMDIKFVFGFLNRTLKTPQMMSYQSSRTKVIHERTGRASWHCNCFSGPAILVWPCKRSMPSSLERFQPQRVNTKPLVSRAVSGAHPYFLSSRPG